MSDIQNWAKMLNEDIESDARDNEAHQKYLAEAQEAEKRELESVDEQELDLESLGITEKETADQAAMVEAEENDKIDFSAYGIAEADKREPVSHTLDPIGVKASTANLKAQDTTEISLAEAVKKLAEAIDKKDDQKKVNEELGKKCTRKYYIMTPGTDGDVNIEVTYDADDYDTAIFFEQIIERGLESHKKENAVQYSSVEFRCTSKPSDEDTLFEAESKEESKEVVESDGLIEADGETEKQEDMAAEVAGDLNAKENPEAADADIPETTPEYEEYAKTDWDALIKRGVELADKAQRYLSRGDKQPLPPKEQKELDDIVKKTGISQEDLTPGSKSGFAPGSFPFLKFPKKAGKEGPNDEWQDTYDTHSTVEPGTGKPGEHYIGPIPNANMDVNPDDHFNRQKNRIKAREETAKADRMRKILHPDVPERGKESWGRSDWNMVVSNFDDKERKELEDALFADAKTGEEQAFVKNLFGKDMKDTDWGKAWGVGGSAINQLRFKLFQRMKLALEKIGYIKPDHVTKTIEKTRAAIARQNELAEMYNKAVEAAGAEKGKPGAIGFEIEKLNIKEKGVKETMIAMADSGIKKIKPVKQPQEGVLRDTIILKTVKGFAANPKVSQIDIDKFVRWMKAFSYNDTHSKINSKLTADERKEYEEVRKAVADKKATPEQKQRFKELIAKRKGMSLSTLTNGEEK